MKNFLLSENKNIRTITILSSILIVTLSYISIFYFKRFEVIEGLILIIVSYIISLVIVNFKFKLREIFSLLIFTSIIVFLFFTLNYKYPFIFYNAYASFFIFILYLILIYSSFLHISIINVLKVELVPLVRFSYTINYIISIILLYLSFLLAFSQSNILFKLFYIVFLSFIIISQNLVSLGYDIDDVQFYGIFGAITFLVLGVLFLIYPVIIYISALSLSLVAYIYIGILLHSRISNLELLNYVEYLFIGIIIFIVLLILPIWGISGGLFI